MRLRAKRQESWQVCQVCRSWCHAYAVVRTTVEPLIVCDRCVATLESAQELLRKLELPQTDILSISD